MAFSLKSCPCHPRTERHRTRVKCSVCEVHLCVEGCYKNFHESYVHSDFLRPYVESGKHDSFLLRHHICRHMEKIPSEKVPQKK